MTLLLARTVMTGAGSDGLRVLVGLTSLIARVHAAPEGSGLRSEKAFAIVSFVKPASRAGNDTVALWSRSVSEFTSWSDQFPSMLFHAQAADLTSLKTVWVCAFAKATVLIAGIGHSGKALMGGEVSLTFGCPPRNLVIAMMDWRVVCQIAQWVVLVFLLRPRT